jgi:hypothetical protein
VEILKFDSAPRSSRGKSKSTSKPLFAIVGMVAIAALGTTLAGSITMNSGNAVEFGQGVSVTASCDVTGGITLAPSASFVNAANGTGVFNLGTIAFSGIDSTCAGKVFTLKGYDNVAGSAPLKLVTTGGSSTWDFATFAFSTVTANNHSSNTNGVYGAASANGTNGTYDLGWTDTRTASAQNVFKFTLESSAN